MQGVPQNERSEFRGFTCKGFPKTSKASLGGSRARGRFSISGNTTIGNINPYKYRGYYFDNETALYFLKTRYYDPDVGRFISMDDVSYSQVYIRLVPVALLVATVTVGYPVGTPLS